MNKGNVTVLGSNGHLGNAAMAAFHAAGWRVWNLRLNLGGCGAEEQRDRPPRK